jgi:hypothetical protein
MKPTISQIHRIRQIVTVLALQVVIAFNILNLFDNSAIANPTTPEMVNLIAYDIDPEIDQQRKQKTQEQYGEKVGEIVDDALKNNKESPQYKIKREDPLNQKVGKFFQQVKDKGLIDVDEDNKSSNSKHDKTTVEGKIR